MEIIQAVRMINTVDVYELTDINYSKWHNSIDDTIFQSGLDWTVTE